MNLLKQTALILGLTSLSVFAWTLYKSWRKKVAIEFAVICLFVAIWSLSFVAHATLSSRLAYDIHRFFNIWLAPVGVMFLGRFLTQEDQFSKWVKRVSWGGAIVLSLMVTFSVQSFYDTSTAFSAFVRFWPIMVFIQFVNIVIQDVWLKRPVSFEFISTGKRTLLYLGIALALTTCSFDHIPELGYAIPSIGNLLFTAFLVFASQVVSPQRFFRAEALVSRFFATLILALVITGFFALLYQYVSDSFPVFLLNSFLLSFATLVLWNPLVTLFRYIAARFLKTKSKAQEEVIFQFKSALSQVSSIAELRNLIKKYFEDWMVADQVDFFLADQINIPKEVAAFFSKNDTPILHKQLVQLEIEQDFARDSRQSWEIVLQFLNEHKCDIVFPVLDQKNIRALVLVRIETTLEDAPVEWSLGFVSYESIYSALQEVNEVLMRLLQIEAATEKQRLEILGEMAAGLAHEVRNPLGAIRGAAELLDESAGPWAKVIQEEVQRLNRLVSQFLDLSHVSGELQETCELNSLIQNSLSNLQFPTQQIKLSDAKVPVKVVPDHVRQIVINLVQNALQATHSDNEKINISIYTREINGKLYAVFEVKDQGIGIPTEDLAKVVQPFFTTFKNGTGLGLSICDRLVKLNNGFMEINSIVGEGTTVKVYLPYAG